MPDFPAVPAGLQHLFAVPLDLFSAAEVAALQARIELRSMRGKATPHVDCIIRGKEIVLKPEEVVRQLFAAQLLEKYGYPKSRIAFEHPIAFGREKKSADIVIFDKDRPDAAYIIIETKKPKLKDGKEQLKSYCHATGAPIAVWTNGGQISYYHRKDPNYFEDIPGIPCAHEKLSDILTERWTIDDLRRKDKLVSERKSLKSLVLEMEDEVLANAGVDVFEELFKLIFTKLFDEMQSGRDRKRHLQFRNYGDTESELKAKIHTLFTQAKNTWDGVFATDSKIELTPAHLSICVASLQDVKLFNSNLEVVDEAFEYLISKSSKGEKGQYFTPRYVIDMCVKMLNPQAHETLIDTAAGSCGFPVHGIFHVWEHILKQNGKTKGHLFSAEAKPAACTDYVNDNVFAIDFDEKAVRVARTLNLIAGDGQTNVLHLNTLDWPNWPQTVKDEAWADTYHSGWKKLRRLQVDKNSYRHFGFDILMANPPFAGDIKQSAMLAQYELARDAKGKLKAKVGRDILFIERNLDFLKPGGRMAIVLPQGRFNNASDAAIRHWLAGHGRILAVVGLHGNVFKPHTGTKTSVLFFQKWHDTLCPRVDDYPIFFATMQKPGKDNSGEKIYLKNPDGSPRLDSHDHLVVDHDLYNHEGLTRDGIAEAFIEFAKKEKLAFFLSGDCGFDEKKYAALREMVACNEATLAEVKKTKDARLDSQFWTGVSRKNTNLKYRKISEILESSQYGISIEMNEEGKGFPTYRMNEIHHMLCDCTVAKHADISAEDAEPFFLESGDVLFNRTNSYEMVGRTGVFYETSGDSARHVFASYLVRINPKHEIILPEYLTAFLNTKQAIKEIRRRARQSINQTNVNPEELKEIEIPLLGMEAQQLIQNNFRLAFSSIIKANALYDEAQSLLLTELGLENYQPNTDNIAVCSFKDSFGKIARLDAEYYQPRYAQMVERIQSYAGGYKKLSECANLIKGVEVGAEAYQESGVPFVRVSNLSPFGLTEEKYIADALYETLRHCQPEQHDILLSKDASPGIACHLAEPPQKMIVSGGVLRLQKKTAALNHASLTLILNSILVKEQINRDAGGSVILHWRPDQIQDTIIPVIPAALQKTLNTKLDESHTLRHQSQTLLAHAKTAVELAIEHDEARALDFLRHAQAGLP